MAAPVIKKADSAEADAELVSRALVGDETAHAALYRRHAPRLAALVYRVLGRDEDLDDIIQETFVEAFRQLGSVADPTRLSAYLATIAVRRIHRRLAWKYRVRGLATRLFGIAPQVSDPRACEGVHELYRALQHVPAKQRIAWVLHRVEGHTLPEVSGLCDISLATVKRWVAVADAKLEVLDATP